MILSFLASAVGRPHAPPRGAGREQRQRESGELCNGRASLCLRKAALSRTKLMKDYNGFSSAQRNGAQAWLRAEWASGRLAKPVRCCACGQDQGVIDAHAEDYSAPFRAGVTDGFHLCYVCHMNDSLPSQQGGVGRVLRRRGGGPTRRAVLPAQLPFVQGAVYRDRQRRLCGGRGRAASSAGAGRDHHKRLILLNFTYVYATGKSLFRKRKTYLMPVILKTSPDAIKLAAAVDRYCALYRHPDLPKFIIHDFDLKTWEGADVSYKPGCYAVYSAVGVLLVLGKASLSKSVGTRLVRFRHRPVAWEPSPALVQIIEVTEAFEAPSLEEYLIREFQPPFNSQGIKRPPRMLEEIVASVPKI
jgi:hypothetical protein